MTRRLAMVPLTGRGATAMVWAYFVTMAVLAIWSLAEVTTPWATIGSLGLFGLMCAVVTRGESERLALGPTLLVVLGWPLITASISWNLLVVGGYAHWFLGAATTSAFYIALRGRIGAAWLTFGLVGAVSMVWAITTDVGVPTDLALLAKQAPVLLVGTLFALGIERTARSIETLAAVEAARAEVDAAESAMASERRERLAQLDAVATPLLRRLVRPEPLTDDDRAHFARAESEVRDSIRARSLSVEPVLSAVRRARERGVDIVLLDDSDPSRLHPGDLEAAVERVAAAIESTASGRVVARLLPPGRLDVATILVEEAQQSRRESVAATPTTP